MPPPLLSAQDLSKSFGIDTLFKGITFTVAEDERIALIGPNGSGKSTLLRMLAGLEDPDSGTVHPRRNLRCIYVAQEDRFDETLTARETIAKTLTAAGHDEHEIEGEVSIALGKAGFEDPDVLVSTLSGGWKKRLSITRGLVMDPELLLLDEPTNHLDINGVLWLEELLSQSRFSLVFVSHDRYFIERLAQRVVEISRRYPQGFFSADGDYADFIEARSGYIEGLRQTHESLSNRARQEVAWLRQGAKARTTKSKHRSEEAYKLIDEVKNTAFVERKAVLEFASSQRKSKELIKIEKVSKSYGGRTIFKDISLVLSPGVRLGVVGGNGSGKTTFIKLLLGEIPPDTGQVVHASQLRYAFFDQARRQLDRSLTLKKALCPDGDGVVFNGVPMHVTSWAKRFLFKSDQLATPVSSLSGGEQARLLLAKIMLVEADILLFDEPTNDLDIDTLEVLEESFCDFGGAIVLVTHDRYLLDRTATTVLGLTPQGANLYGDYQQWEAERNKKPQLKSSERAQESKVSSSPKARTKFSFKEQKEYDSMEGNILAAEELLGEHQKRLASGEIASDAYALKECCEKIASQQKVVDALYARWAELEEIKKGFAS